MKYVFMAGYFGFLIILIYYYFSSRKIEKQTPDFIKEKFNAQPKRLWQTIAIALSFITFVLAKSEIADFMAYVVFFALLCKENIDRIKFFNSYKKSTQNEFAKSI